MINSFEEALALRDYFEPTIVEIFNEFKIRVSKISVESVTLPEIVNISISFRVSHLRLDDITKYSTRAVYNGFEVSIMFPLCEYEEKQIELIDKLYNIAEHFWSIAK